MSLDSSGEFGNVGSRVLALSWRFFFEMGFRGVARIMFFLNGSMLKLQNACFASRRKNAPAAVVENNVFAVENW